MDLPLSPRIRATGAPPIPAVRGWAARYQGGAGPVLDMTQAVPGYPPHAELLMRLAAAAGDAKSAGYGPIEGEAALRDLAGDRASVLRLGGIYGPGRHRQISEVRAGVGCPREPVRFTNRIHRDDAGGILQFLLERQAAGERLQARYLGVDCAPAPMWEVRHWLAEQLGVSLDDSRPLSDARGGNKRCSNRRLLAAGYRFMYPDYRAGYGALLAAP
jgi:nucleoside-diphosphate-sugar epimerase